MRQTKFALVTIIGCVMISLFFITPVIMEANILRMQDQKGDEVSSRACFRCEWLSLNAWNSWCDLLFKDSETRPEICIARLVVII